ncbi:hypothetical protein O0I10_008059 [Lichtheimia ornata]|uniref:Uncharacterized protein n=1 Tax=Lichtheimia ornata TaxID=688661 RepID=A0AAD7V0Z8_9FUNG|nr:uncharacterized protein O0I10_008059 [Lichtheimia ornata]KAJ8656265.1 hypothetical protein O0I10_008059 [Lichtheimia ornata]
MAPLPPLYRTFVRPETLPEKKSYPAPGGFSQVITPTLYIKYAIFIEQDDQRGLIPIHKLEKAIAKALTLFYLFAGRLTPEPRGRFSIQDFDKGCLFQVCELPDSFEEYKKNHFGYATVPVDELMPIHHCTSFDTPLFGVQLTQLQGGQALSYSLNHRLAEGVALSGFTSALTYALRHDKVPHIEMYYDWQRPPLKPSPKYDHSIDYPVMKEIPKRMAAMDPGPSTKRVFAFAEDKAQELKRQMKQEMPDKDVRLSVRDAITAFMYRAIVKARRLKGQCNLVYAVSTRHVHPDKRMMQHFGNYFVPTTVPGEHDELIHSPLVSIAQRIREHVGKVNPEYMDSLEYYLNNQEDLTKVSQPVSRMTAKDVIWSDASRYVSDYDFGYGKHCSVTRNWTDPKPMAVVAGMPRNNKGEFELVVQLDPESMERLMNDKQVQYYTLGAF